MNHYLKLSLLALCGFGCIEASRPSVSTGYQYQSSESTRAAGREATAHKVFQAAASKMKGGSSNRASLALTGVLGVSALGIQCYYNEQHLKIAKAGLGNSNIQTTNSTAQLENSNTQTANSTAQLANSNVQTTNSTAQLANSNIQTKNSTQSLHVAKSSNLFQKISAGAAAGAAAGTVLLPVVGTTLGAVYGATLGWMWYRTEERHREAEEKKNAEATKEASSEERSAK